MMSLNDVLLYVLFPGVLAPTVFAAQALYLTRKEKSPKRYRQRMVHMTIVGLGATIGLLIGHLLVGDGLFYSLDRLFPYFLMSVIAFPTTWLILMYVEKKRTSQKYAPPQS